MLRVEPKLSYFCKVPTEWATNEQKDNLFKSLVNLAREKRFAKIYLRELTENPIIFGFKPDEKVLKVMFARQDNNEAWTYSLTENGLCESNSYPIGPGKHEAPKVLFSWKDFEKGEMFKPKPDEDTNKSDKEKSGKESA